MTRRLTRLLVASATALVAGDGQPSADLRGAEMNREFPDRTTIAEMFQPVRCTWCGGVYDLGKVEVTARYADCSMWKAPCCGNTVDDRGDTGWKSRRDYERINKANPTGDRWISIDGRHARWSR